MSRASPGDAHHHGDDDGDLHGSDDGGDEDVVQLLSTGDHVEDVEVLRLVTLRTFVACVASGTDNGHCSTLHVQQTQKAFVFGSTTDLQVAVLYLSSHFP